MKRIFLFLTMILALSVATAFAADGATVYKKCAGCHGADGSKIVSASGQDTLKGQSAAAIKAKLKGYADGTFGGKKAKLMQKVAAKLTPEQMDAVASHIGTL